MSIKWSSGHLNIDSAIAVRVGPLGEGDRALVQIGIADIAPAWSVELEGICPGESALVLLPDGGDDSNGPSFVITRETFGFKMDQVYWDTLTEVGVYSSLHQVLHALRSRLAICTSQSAPASVTLH